MRAKQIFKSMSSITNTFRVWVSRASTFFRSQSAPQHNAAQNNAPQNDDPQSNVSQSNVSQPNAAQSNALLQEALAAITDLHTAVAALKSELQELKEQQTLPRPLPLGRGVVTSSLESADDSSADKSIYSPPSTGGAGGGSVGAGGGSVGGGSLVDGSPVCGSFSLVYAGALVMRKNSYLLELAHKAQHFTLHIYGNSDGLPGIDKAPHAVCYPFTPADEFIRSADGDFGLVWDGDSLETCQGDFGEYLRYNSPHKVSFYLRAGLPVIIWREAAVAPIIEHEGIGFTIGSIAELEQRLQGLTSAELEQMRKNVARVSARLASGQFFREALQRVL